MKTTILIVEDNPDILFNLVTTLELNNYNVEKATNGVEALELLSSTKKLPDLIISDIIMPQMDGYELFKKISENPRLNLIPFIFLTARASPEDLRFGKMLGVDDYLTKPVKQKDLLATIAGKLTRASSFKQHFEKVLASKWEDEGVKLSSEERKSVVLFSVIWSSKKGPILEDIYTQELQTPHMDKIGLQLYHSAVSVYGQHEVIKPEGLLLRIQNLDMMGYIYFDAIKDVNNTSRPRTFMLAVIAPKINYFSSLEIKEIFKDIASKKKARQNVDIKSYWKQIANILAPNSVDNLSL